MPWPSCLCRGGRVSFLILPSCDLQAHPCKLEIRWRAAAELVAEREKRDKAASAARTAAAEAAAERAERERGAERAQAAAERSEREREQPEAPGLGREARPKLQA